MKKKPCFFTQNLGYSLIELLVVSSLSVVLSVSALYFISLNFSYQKQFQNKTSLVSLRTEIASFFLNNEIITSTIEASINPSLQCLKNGTSCYGQTGQFALVQDIGGTPTPIYQMHVPGQDDNQEQGFDLNGKSCNTFDKTNGNPSCPYRYEFSWKALCQPPCNQKVIIELKADFFYRPGASASQTSVINENNMKITFLTVQEGHSIPPVGKFTGTFYCNFVSFPNGKLLAWGNNYPGTCGIGSTSPIYPPVQPIDTTGTPVTNVKLIFEGCSEHSCVITADNKVMCAGSNKHGEIGANLPTGAGSYQNKFTYVVDSFGNPLTDIEDGYCGTQAMSCAKKTNGEIWCWGNNFLNRMGLEIPGSYTVAVDGSNNIDKTAEETKIYPYAIKSHHLCDSSPSCNYPSKSLVFNNYSIFVLLNEPEPRRITSWGGDFNARFLLGGNLNHPAAGQTYYWPPEPSGGEQIVKPGNALYDSYVPGSPPTIQNLHPNKRRYVKKDGTENDLTGVLDVRVNGNATACALLDNTGVHCWGTNYSGTGSINLKGAKPVITNLGPALNQVTKIKPGAQHFCALTSAKELWCWGGNSYGQLGLGTTDSKNEAHNGFSVYNGQIIDFLTGKHHTCIQTISNEFKCVGRNVEKNIRKDLSDNAILVPVDILGLDP